jgi:hypothetical protein
MGVLLGGFYMAGAASWVVREVARRLGGSGSLRCQFLKIKGKWEGKRWGTGQKRKQTRQGAQRAAVAAGWPKEDDDSAWAGIRPKTSSGPEARWVG